MMDIAYDSFISSPAFKFLIGVNKRDFTVHAGLVTHLSKPLGVMVNGPMSEAIEGCAWLEDVDEHTFVRFCQYAYTGDYSPADPEILLDSNNVASTPSDIWISSHNQCDSAVSIGTAPTQEERDPEDNYDEDSNRYSSRWSTSHSRVEKRKGKSRRSTLNFEGSALPLLSDCGQRKAATASQSKKSKLWDKFKGRYSDRLIPNFKPRRNREECEDYTEVFLGHARLYVFAEKYDINRLKELSLHKLQCTLAEFTIYSQRVGDIIDLMKYTYLNTPERSESSDSLRSLVTHYAACVVEDLAQNTQFQQLVEEMGPLGRDIIGQLLDRLD